MSMKVTEGKVILRGETAKAFNESARKPNVNTIRRREQYFREIDTKVNVEKRTNGVRITVR
ncbi:MAG: hypothetical protein ABRQ27_09790 [Clostridiaceae bacterium]